MLYSPEEIRNRAKEYCDNRGLSLQSLLGFGVQAMVFATSRKTAIKVHAREEPYGRERGIYQRLSEHNIEQIRGLTVPLLRDFDDTVWVLEISIVSPPFLLDFGGAYLDRPRDFDFDVAEWELEKQDEFGSKWAEVRLILSELRGCGVYLADVRASNIRFA